MFAVIELLILCLYLFHTCIISFSSFLYFFYPGFFFSLLPFLPISYNPNTFSHGRLLSTIFLLPYLLFPYLSILFLLSYHLFLLSFYFSSFLFTLIGEEHSDTVSLSDIPSRLSAAVRRLFFLCIFWKSSTLHYRLQHICVLSNI